jgi:hypothetical protein
MGRQKILKNKAGAVLGIGEWTAPMGQRVSNGDLEGLAALIYLSISELF